MSSMEWPPAPRLVDQLNDSASGLELDEWRAAEIRRALSEDEPIAVPLNLVQDQSIAPPRRASWIVAVAAALVVVVAGTLAVRQWASPVQPGPATESPTEPTVPAPTNEDVITDDGTSAELSPNDQITVADLCDSSSAVAARSIEDRPLGGVVGLDRSAPLDVTVVSFGAEDDWRAIDQRHMLGELNEVTRTIVASVSAEQGEWVTAPCGLGRVHVFDDVVPEADWLCDPFTRISAFVFVVDEQSISPPTLCELGRPTVLLVRSGPVGDAVVADWTAELGCGIAQVELSPTEEAAKNDCSIPFEWARFDRSPWEPEADGERLAHEAILRSIWLR